MLNIFKRNPIDERQLEADLLEAIKIRKKNWQLYTVIDREKDPLSKAIAHAAYNKSESEYAKLQIKFNKYIKKTYGV